MTNICNAVSGFVFMIYVAHVYGQCETPCPDTWVTFKGSCYLFSDEILINWTEATHLCATHQSHLVTVESRAEDLFVEDYARRFYKNENDRTGHWFWMGMTDIDVEGLWRWYTDDSELDSSKTYVNWHSGEPNQDGDCGVLWGTFKGWGDYPCNGKAHVVCEKSFADDSTEIVGK